MNIYNDTMAENLILKIKVLKILTVTYYVHC